MGMGDPEVIGCVATLGTVRHEDLNRLLSTLYGGSMQILIVESRAVSAKLEKHLHKKVCQQQYMPWLRVGAAPHTLTLQPIYAS